jgi:small-conductance mechanosensitive channel
MFEKKIHDFFNYMTSTTYLKSVVASILVFALVFLINRILVKSIRGSKNDKLETNVAIKRINFYSRIFTVILISLMWFSHLQGVLVSFLAVAAAIVLAFKELIMCVTGGMLIRSSSTFKIGDRIEINHIRGFVIERGLLSTKILEIGPESNSQQTTGNIITLSNNLVFTHSVKNESYFRGYSIKSYFFKVKKPEDVDRLEEFLLTEGKVICGDYIEDAKASISSFCLKEGIIIPSLEARTKLIVDKDTKFSILLRIPVRNTEIADVEQRLNRKYLNYITNHVPQKV